MNNLHLTLFKIYLINRSSKYNEYFFCPKNYSPLNFETIGDCHTIQSKLIKMKILLMQIKYLWS